MKMEREKLPEVRPELGALVRGVDWGDMNAATLELPEGTDFCPLLEGLKNNHCQCPHWGYLIEGRIRVSYEDGTSETINAGELYYWPPGHTVYIEAPTKQIEFSPAREMDAVLDHVAAKIRAANAAA